MAIFRKKITRKSAVQIAIEADSREQADQIFNDWLDDERKNEELNEILSERAVDHEEWMPTFDNWGSYNMNTTMDDILIGGQRKNKEPKYDLYISFDGTGSRSGYLDCTMDLILEELQKINKDYILKPALASIECIDDAQKRGCLILYYRATRRTK